MDAGLSHALTCCWYGQAMAQALTTQADELLAAEPGSLCNNHQSVPTKLYHLCWPPSCCTLVGPGGGSIFSFRAQEDELPAPS